VASDPVPPQTTNRHTKRVRLVRPGYIGITIGEHGTEYVMSISEANDLIGLIYHAKHGFEARDRC
jgi:hypothetical protein